MAKSTIGRGQFRGKLGGDVFYIRNGAQLIRAYQPVVNNPKSSTQQLQRAKGALAGKVSAITPWQVIQGLNGSKNERRSRFLQLLMQGITSSYATGSATQINATLLSNNYKFAEGAIVPAIHVKSVVPLASYIDITIERMAGSTIEDFQAQGVLLVAVIKNASGDYEKVIYQFVDNNDITGDDLTVNLPHNSSSNYYAAVYAAPFSVVAGKLSTVVDNLFGTATSLDIVMHNNAASLPINWGDSYLVNEVTFPVTQSTMAKKTKV